MSSNHHHGLMQQSLLVATLCFFISQNYISHWTYLYGFRQYLQNWMDAILQTHPNHKIIKRVNPQNQLKIKFVQANQNGQLIQSNYIQYDKTQKTLTLNNDKAFDLKCMIMGCSIKPEGALGQFGQGMKISMISVLRQQFGLLIQSGDKIYQPYLSNLADAGNIFANTYDKNVLFMRFQNRERKQQTKVIINNVEPQHFQDFRYLSLALIDPTKFKRIKCGQSELIVTDDVKLKGKVYKKSIRLELKDPQQGPEFKDFTYNFEKIEVGRDRNCVNCVWDLYRLQSKLHFDLRKIHRDPTQINSLNQLKTQDLTLQDVLKNHQKTIYEYLCRNKHETWYFSSFANQSQSVCNFFYNKYFHQQYNTLPEVYPSHTNSHQIKNYLKQSNLTSDFYEIRQTSWQLYPVLTKSSSYISVENKFTKFIQNVAARDLNDNEKMRLDGIRTRVGSLFPTLNNFNFMIKDVDCMSVFRLNNQENMIYLNSNKINQQDLIEKQLIRLLLG